MHLLQTALGLILPAAYIIPTTSASSVTRNPLISVEAVRAPSISPRHVHAHSRFDLSFHAFKRRIRFALQPNEDIIAPDAHVNYLDKNGDVSHSERIVREDHRVYLGDVWTQNVDGGFSRTGHARVMVHRDGDQPLFEAAFDVDGDHHHIQLSSRYNQLRHDLDPRVRQDKEDYMVVFRDSDISATDLLHGELKRRALDNMVCGSDQLDFNMDPEHPLYSSGHSEQDRFFSEPIANLLGRRQMDSSTGTGNSAGVNLASSIGSTAGCPSTRKVALVGVATDCEYAKTFTGGNDQIRSNVIQQMSSASALYEKTFNISLGLQNLTISPAECPGTAPAATPWNVPCGSADIQQRLNLFSSWRGKQPDNNSHWTLLTNCNTGSAVGLAWLGQACVVSADARNGTSGGVQTISGANVVARTSTEWQVIADGTSTRQQCCPLSSGTCDASQRYIMNPSTAQGITNFSPCSIGNICSAMGRNSVKTACFSSNRGVPLITGAQCGNGIVEDGEDCDCGGTANCGNNACCDAKTCKFKNGAVCDDSNEECCRNCKLAAANTVCRASTGVCDPQEVCNGTSPICPADKTADDGSDCGGGLKCASGHCTSRDQQCKTLMGSYTQGNDTYACDSSTCTLSCASPEFGRNMCYGLQQNFLDGTPCGGGGKCVNGQCKGSNFGKEIKSWIDSHRGLVIGIACAIGAILLLMILSCCWRAYQRKKRGVGTRRTATKWPAMLAQQKRGRGSGSSPADSWTGGGSTVVGSGSHLGGDRRSRSNVHSGTFPPPPPVNYYGGGSSVRYA